MIDLRRVLDDLPLAHQQDSTRAVVSSFVRRNPFFVGPAVLGVAAIIGWAVTAQILSVGYERERDRARAEEQRAIRTRDAVIDIFRRSSPQQTDTLFTPSANQSAWSYLAQAAEATMEDLSEEPETVLELLYWTIAIDRFHLKGSRQSRRAYRAIWHAFARCDAREAHAARYGTVRQSG